jgi:hypothetical protein
VILAGVAELADAHGSGPCARKGVQVQVLSPVLLRNFSNTDPGDATPGLCHLPGLFFVACALECVAAGEFGFDGALHRGFVQAPCGADEVIGRGIAADSFDHHCRR